MNLSTPDVVGTIAIAGTGGKVALVSNTSALSSSNPASGALVDLVGWGTSANGFETAAAPATVNTIELRH